MSDALQHDPRTKSMIKDLLYDHLYRPMEEHFRKRINSIIHRNTTTGNFAHNSFLHRGNIYQDDLTALPRRMNPLLPQFRDEMEEYLADLNRVNGQELPYVMGYINQVLNASNDLHDYMRLLPQQIHQPLLDLMAICPCRKIHLPEAKVQEITEKNQNSISLIRQRLVLNLLY
jgi:hypothetical protein